MALPASIAYGTVTWQSIAAAADGADGDGNPDAVPMTGTVTFTPSATVLLATAPPAVTVITTPVTYNLDTAGVLRDSEGREGVMLVATDSPGLTPTGWTWMVSYRLTTAQGQGISRGSFSFSLPAGSTVDLTKVTPVGSSGGVPIIQGPPGPGFDVPAGASLVFATEDTAVADAHPEYTWLILEPTGTPTDTTAPAVPAGLTATAGNGQIVLDWSDVADADLARYDYRIDTTNPPTSSAVSTGTTSGATVTGLTNGTTYYAQARAVDATGNASAWSTVASATPTAPAQTDTTAPSVPGTPTATAGNTQASVAFTAATDDVAVTGYRVYSSADGYTAPVATGAASPITVTGLTNGTAYTFKVSAGDAAGNWSAQSAASNTVTPTAPSTSKVTLTDDFTGTPGAALTGRPGVAAGGGNFVIDTTGTLAQRATTQAAAQTVVYGPLSSSDNYARVTVPARGGAVNVGPICRANSAMDTFYALRAQNSNAIELIKSVAGTVTVLGTSPLATYTPGDVLEVRAVGTTVTCYQNGTLLTTVTDTSIAAGTYGGIRSGGNASFATFDALTVADA